MIKKSNGKNVSLNGKKFKEGLEAGEIVLGEAGTNAQHSFFQLMHQGRKIPVDFIGFAQCSNDSKVDEDDVSAHDELMSNFFAQVFSFF